MYRLVNHDPGKKKGNKLEDEDDIISHRHDKFFRAALDNLTVAKELIKANLLPELKKLVDFDSLKPEKDSFISKSLRKSICDVLFSAKLKGNGNGNDECLFLLIESQSKPDYWMALRLMKYMLGICSRYLKNHKKATKLPLVYPIIVYQGKQKYNAACNFWDLFAIPDLAKKIWSEEHLVIMCTKSQMASFCRKYGQVACNGC